MHIARPPDPNPSEPRLECPPGAVDTHFHLFGPTADYPFVPDTPYLTEEALPETLIAMHDRIGIARGVIVNGGAYGRGFRHLADTLVRFPNRFRGIVVPPDHMNLADMQRLDGLGVCGIRFIGDAGGRHVAHILPEVAARAAELGWLVQFMPQHGNLPDHVERLLALRNDIVIDHFGMVIASQGVDQPAFRDVLRLLDTGRVWVKLSGPMYCSEFEFPYPDLQPFADILVRHAPERLLWGSDWPHLHMGGRAIPNDGPLLDVLLDWVPDEKVRAMVLATNAAKLYGFA
jgi:2-pyrone-4,6-dicarboxylate lactonase